MNVVDRELTAFIYLPQIIEIHDIYHVTMLRCLVGSVEHIRTDKALEIFPLRV